MRRGVGTNTPMEDYVMSLYVTHAMLRMSVCLVKLSMAERPPKSFKLAYSIQKSSSKTCLLELHHCDSQLPTSVEPHCSQPDLRMCGRRVALRVSPFLPS